MIPPCKCKPMQSTTLGKSLRGGHCWTPSQFLWLLQMKWGALKRFRSRRSLLEWETMQRYQDNLALLLPLWCCMGWNYLSWIWHGLYVFSNNAAFCAQFQNTKGEAESCRSTKASSIVIQGGTRNADLTLYYISFCHLSFRPHFDWQRGAGRGELGRSAERSTDNTSSLANSTISIQPFSGFSLSGHHNLSAAKYYGCLQLATL